MCPLAQMSWPSLGAWGLQENPVTMPPSPSSPRLAAGRIDQHPTWHLSADPGSLTLPRPENRGLDNSHGWPGLQQTHRKGHSWGTQATLFKVGRALKY